MVAKGGTWDVDGIGESVCGRNCLCSPKESGSGFIPAPVEDKSCDEVSGAKAMGGMGSGVSCQTIDPIRIRITHKIGMAGMKTALSLFPPLVLLPSIEEVMEFLLLSSDAPKVGISPFSQLFCNSTMPW